MLIVLLLLSNAAVVFAQSDTAKTGVVETNLQVNDLKKGFKNLFTSSLGNSIDAQQLNPQAISFVQNYMQKNTTGLRQMKGWGKPYFDMIDGILAQHGLPKELKYLAVIESGLRVNALSWAGAVGPWALMPATARMYGMRVTRQQDERTDYIKSTHVAARLLSDLFTKYNDWLLVIAAYNGGPGNVNKAIRKSGSTDFWKLQYHLPAESQNHVKKFIATHYIMEGEGGETTITQTETASGVFAKNSLLTAAELSITDTLSISGRYKASIITRHLTIPEKDFEKYNPSFDEIIANAGRFLLRLPKDKIQIFLQNKTSILDESLRAILQKIERP